MTRLFLRKEAKKLTTATYLMYLTRKLQIAGYAGPITISNYQRFQWIRETLEKEGVKISMLNGN